jgi:hypothetical protein
MKIDSDADGPLEAEAQTGGAAIAHKVLVTLNGHKLYVWLPSVHERGRNAKRDARPVACGPLALEGEGRTRRSMDEAGLDVALIIGVLVHPGDTRLWEQHAVWDPDGDGCRHPEATLHRSLVEARVVQLDSGLALFSEGINPRVAECESEARADGEAAERVIVAGRESGRIQIFGVIGRRVACDCPPGSPGSGMNVSLRALELLLLA